MHFTKIASVVALATTIMALPTNLNDPSLARRGLHDHQKCVKRGRPWGICNWWQDDSGPTAWAPCKKHQWLPWCKEDQDTKVAEAKRIKEEHDAMRELDRKLGNHTVTSTAAKQNTTSAVVAGAVGKGTGTSAVKPNTAGQQNGKKTVETSTTAEKKGKSVIESRGTHDVSVQERETAATEKDEPYVLCFWLTGCVGDSKERAQRQYWLPYMLPFW